MRFPQKAYLFQWTCLHGKTMNEYLLRAEVASGSIQPCKHLKGTCSILALSLLSPGKYSSPLGVLANIQHTEARYQYQCPFTWPLGIGKGCRKGEHSTECLHQKPPLLL